MQQQRIVWKTQTGLWTGTEKQRIQRTTPIPGHQQQQMGKKHQRYKKVSWFNSPFSLGIKTKLGKEFLALIEKHFSPGNPWRKHFNRHTVKLSYSCTKTISAHINSHNQKLMRGQDNKASCNCKVKGWMSIKQGMPDKKLGIPSYHRNCQPRLCILWQHSSNFQRKAWRT